jgi:hypothetical protein
MNEEILTISGTVKGWVERLHEIRENVRILTPVIREELKEMDDATFWKTVCHSVISDKLEEVPEGTHLFQCSWNNHEIFNDRNSPITYMILKDAAAAERQMEKKPQVWVNIARLARFSLDCPCSEMFRCHLRNFRFAPSEKTDKRERL